jgi:hypothetical protein
VKTPSNTLTYEGGENIGVTMNGRLGYAWHNADKGRDVFIFRDPTMNGGDYIYYLNDDPLSGEGFGFDRLERCRMITELKNQNGQAIEYFLNKLEPLFGKGFAIAVVPPRDCRTTSSGIRILAQRLAFKDRHDATSCLIRQITIPGPGENTDRDVGMHLDSIGVFNTYRIQDRDVLLLDDVITTGNSLKACKMLLEQNGAKLVKCFALAYTPHPA